MTLNLTDPILGTRPGFDPTFILGRMKEPDAKDRAFFVALMTWCRVAGIDPAVPASQFLLETDNGSSVRWTRDLNASGMGIVSDGTAQPFEITSVDESARLFVQCLYALVKRKAHPEIPLDGAVLRWFNTVWLPKVQSRAMPDVRTVVDLGLRYTENGDSRATWSWEDGQRPQDSYGKKLVSRLAQFYPSLPDSSDPPVDTPSTPPEEIPEGDNTMPAEIEILSMLIGPQSNAPATLLNRNGKVRPIGHNTSNKTRGADAIMHAKFVASGGGEGGVSFHWAIDSKRAVQIITMDRIAYHASDGCDNRQTDTGCYDGIAFENCDNADGDIRKTFDNFCRVIARIEWGQDPRINYGTMPKEYFKGFIDRLLGHHDVAYDAKWCPEDFMDLYGEEGWKVEAKKRAKGYLAELQGMTPAEPAEPTTPVYAVPDKPKAGTFKSGSNIFVGVEERLTTKQKVTPRKYAEPDQPPTGPDIPAGTSIDITHIVVASDNNLWLITKDGSRIPASALVAA